MQETQSTRLGNLLTKGKQKKTTLTKASHTRITAQTSAPLSCSLRRANPSLSSTEAQRQNPPLMAEKAICASPPQWDASECPLVNGDVTTKSIKPNSQSTRRKVTRHIKQWQILSPSDPFLSQRSLSAGDRSRSVQRHTQSQHKSPNTVWPRDGHTVWPSRHWHDCPGRFCRTVAAGLLFRGVSYSILWRQTMCRFTI